MRKKRALLLCAVALTCVQCQADFVDDLTKEVSESNIQKAENEASSEIDNDSKSNRRRRRKMVISTTKSPPSLKAGTTEPKFTVGQLFLVGLIRSLNFSLLLR